MLKSPGQVAYETYLIVQGRGSETSWSHLPDRKQRAWHDAATAGAREMVRQMSRLHPIHESRVKQLFPPSAIPNPPCSCHPVDGQHNHTCASLT